MKSHKIKPPNLNYDQWSISYRGSGVSPKAPSFGASVRYGFYKHYFRSVSTSSKFSYKNDKNLNRIKGIINYGEKNLSSAVKTFDIANSDNLRKISSNDTQDISLQANARMNQYKNTAIAKTGVAVTKGTLKAINTASLLTFEITKDIKDGKLSKAQGAAKFKEKIKSKTLGKIKDFGKKLPSNIVKGGGNLVKNEIMNFNDQGDIGLKSLTAQRDAVVKTKRTFKMATNVWKVGKVGVKSTKFAITRAYRGGSALIKKLVTNPKIAAFLVGAVTAVIAFFVVVMPVLNIVGSVVSIFNFMDEYHEINVTYLYMKELETIKEIACIDDFGLAEKVRKYDNVYMRLNGNPIHPNNLYLELPKYDILAYFHCKYTYVSFDAPFGIGGEALKHHINTLFDNLIQSNITESQEMINNVVENNLYIDITVKSFHDYYEKHLKADMEKEQDEKFKAMVGFGPFTFASILGPPIANANWKSLITSELGYRRDPVKQKDKYYNLSNFHQGVDIGVAEGTEVLATHPGRAYVLRNDINGTYVKIEYKDEEGNNLHKLILETQYMHLSDVSDLLKNKEEGKDFVMVKEGDVIGYVGGSSDGDGHSTGAHLHYDIKKHGNRKPENFLNPVMFSK